MLSEIQASGSVRLSRVAALLGVSSQRIDQITHRAMRRFSEASYRDHRMLELAAITRRK